MTPTTFPSFFFFAATLIVAPTVIVPVPVIAPVPVPVIVLFFFWGKNLEFSRKLLTFASINVKKQRELWKQRQQRNSARCTL